MIKKSGNYGSNLFFPPKADQSSASLLFFTNPHDPHSLPLWPYSHPRHISIISLKIGHGFFPLLTSEKLFIIMWLVRNLEGVDLFILLLKSSRLLASEESAHQYNICGFSQRDVSWQVGIWFCWITNVNRVCLPADIKDQII